MALYPLDGLKDALDATKEFLLPFDLRRWAKLALVAFFIGVPGMSVNFPTQYTAPGNRDAWR